MAVVSLWVSGCGYIHFSTLSLWTADAGGGAVGVRRITGINAPVGTAGKVFWLDLGI
jgi:hypothetical protein